MEKLYSAINISNFLYTKLFYIFETYDVMMSSSPQVWVHFWKCFLILNNLDMKLAKLIDIIRGKNFRKKFWWFGGLCPKSRPTLIYQSTAINQNPIMISLCLLFFWRCSVRRPKIINIITEKLTNLNLLQFHQNHEKNWTRFQSSQ